MPGFSQASLTNPALAPADIQSIVTFIRTWEQPAEGRLPRPKRLDRLTPPIPQPLGGRDPMNKPLSRREFLDSVRLAGFGALAASATRAGPGGHYQSAGHLSCSGIGSRPTATCGSTTTLLSRSCVRPTTRTTVCCGHLWAGRGHAHRSHHARTARPRTWRATRTTHRWDPRVMPEELALTRRFYGDRRVQQAHGFCRGSNGGTTRGFRAVTTARRLPEYFDRPCATSGCVCWTTRRRPSSRPRAGEHRPDLLGRGRPSTPATAELRAGNGRSHARCRNAGPESRGACPCWA